MSTYTEGGATELFDFTPTDATLADAQILLRRAGQIEYLDDPACIELAMSYQQSLKAKEILNEAEASMRPYLSKLISRGTSHVSELVNSSFGLAWKPLSLAADQRMGTQWRSNGTKEELQSEVHLFILTKAAEFDPASNTSFKAYLSSAVQGFVSTVMRSVRHSGNMPQAWERSIRIIQRIKSDFRENGKVASKDEILEQFDLQVEKWAQEKLKGEEALLEGDARAEAVWRLKSKQSMTGARKEFDLLLQYAEGEERLDRPYGVEGASTFGEFIPSERSVDDEAFAPEADDLMLKLYAVALGDEAESMSGLMVAYHGLLGSIEGDAVVEEDEGPDRKKAWSLVRVSEHAGIGRVDARNLLKDRAQARLLAPHAQYAHLALGLSLQVEEASDDTFSMVRNLPRDMFA